MPQCARKSPRPGRTLHRSHGSTRRRRPGCPPATLCRTGSETAASAPAWPSRRALVGASESFPELPGSRQSPGLGSFERTPNQGSFPPPVLPGFLGPMSPSDACRARLPDGAVASRLAARQVSRVASPRVRTCCAPYPGERDDRHMSVRLVALVGLRLVSGDSALAFTLSGPAQASLALRPARLLTRPRRASVPRASMGRSPSPSPG